MSNPNPPVHPAPAPRWFVGLAVLFLTVYGLFLATHATTVAGGSDSSGYINSARLLAAGHLQAELRVPAEFGPPSGLNRALFAPHGFFPHPGNAQLPPTYPVGLPLHFAVAGQLLGWHLGPLSVELGSALAALCLCYLLGRELGIGPFLAAAGAAVLGTCPVFIFTSIQPLSDTLATTWTLATVYTAVRARRHRGWAAASGVAFAVAVLVRPTNAVLLPALVVLLGCDWRRLTLVALGGAPGALWLGYYNHTLYGGALRSGYLDWRAAFSSDYAPPTLLHFAHWLGLLLPAVLVVLPLAAPLARDFRNRTLVALALWFSALVAVYACYEVSREVWWCLRFILPALPALILAALLGLEALAQRLAATHRTAFLAATTAVLVVWAVAGSTYWTNRLGVLYTKGYEQVYADAGDAAKKLFPKDALVLSLNTCGALYAYTDFAILRWEQLDPTQFARFAALAQTAGRPICAVLFDTEEKDALRERCPGQWTRVRSVKNVGLWRLAPPPTPVPAQ